MEGGSADDHAPWGVSQVSGQGHGAGWLCHPRVPTLTTYERGPGPVSTPQLPAPQLPHPTLGRLGGGSGSVRAPFPSVASPSRHEQAYGPVSTRQDCGRRWPPQSWEGWVGVQTLLGLVPTSRVSLPLVVSPAIACPSHQSRLPPVRVSTRNLVTPPPRQWYLPAWLHPGGHGAGGGT